MSATTNHTNQLSDTRLQVTHKYQQQIDGFGQVELKRGTGSYTKHFTPAMNGETCPTKTMVCISMIMTRLCILLPFNYLLIPGKHLNFKKQKVHI